MNSEQAVRLGMDFVFRRGSGLQGGCVGVSVRSLLVMYSVCMCGCMYLLTYSLMREGKGLSSEKERIRNEWSSDVLLYFWCGR